MEVLYPRCAGLDVHAATVVACVRIASGATIRYEHRTVSTNTGGLLALADWLTAHEHKDRKYGRIYNYHSRSDAHSIALCTQILDDLLLACPVLKDQSLADKIVYGIKARHVFPNGKKKTLDLAIGTVKTIKAPARFADAIHQIGRASCRERVYVLV